MFPRKRSAEDFGFVNALCVCMFFSVRVKGEPHSSMSRKQAWFQELLPRTKHHVCGYAKTGREPHDLADDNWHWIYYLNQFTFTSACADPGAGSSCSVT